MRKLVQAYLAVTMALLFSAGQPKALASDSQYGPQPQPPPMATLGNESTGKIAPYQSRFGRRRPVVAIVGENSGTELTDYVIPFGVLALADVADTFTLSTQSGPLTMRPAMRIQPRATIEEFDALVPDGADYVIVPAVVRRDDPLLLTWLSAQYAKGSTIVSICDGALVVANSGLRKGRLATAHWATEGLRATRYQETQWEKNVRYIADGRIISSAGISAAIPVSTALVEAIAGHGRAVVLADELGVVDWSPAHNSDAFRPRFGVNLMSFLRTNYSNHWLHRMQHVGVPVATGIDEIALAFTVDAWSRTGRSHAMTLAVSDAPVRTLHGLAVIPDRVVGGADPVDRSLPVLKAMPSAQALDRALNGIARYFGRSTAFGVALDFEYPGFRK